MENVIPEKFEFSIGGFGGDCYSVVHRDNKLVYNPYYFMGSGFSDDGVNISPTQEEWKRFWEKVDNSGVWKWQKRYDNRDVLDGTQWELKFKINGRTKKVYGSNEYPEKFNTFLRAVSELVGGLPMG